MSQHCSGVENVPHRDILIVHFFLLLRPAEYISGWVWWAQGIYNGGILSFYIYYILVELQWLGFKLGHFIFLETCFGRTSAKHVKRACESLVFEATFLIRTGIMGTEMSGRECERLLQPDELLGIFSWDLLGTSAGCWFEGFVFFFWIYCYSFLLDWKMVVEWESSGDNNKKISLGTENHLMIPSDYPPL